MAEENMVRSLRLEKAWSQEQLAECSGLSVRTIQRIENGAKPGLESIKAIAAALGVGISALKLESDEMIREATVETTNVESADNQEMRAGNIVTTGIKFGVILAVLVLINLVFTPGKYWVIWPALGMGIALIMTVVRETSGYRRSRRNR